MRRVGGKSIEQLGTQEKDDHRLNLDWLYSILVKIILNNF